MITWENYEEYMMMHADGELQPAETQELMEFVNQHPQLKNELADLQMVRLTPDMDVVYARKASLLREEPATKRLIAFPAFKRYSIAAGVAAIMILSLYRFMNNNGNDTDNGNILAITKPTTPAQLPAQATPEHILADATDKTQKEAKQEKKSAQEKQHDEPKMAAHEHKAIPRQEGLAKEPEAIAKAAPAENVAELPVTGIKEVESQPATYAMATTREVPVYSLPQSEPESKKTFWDKLPVDDIKKRQLGNMAGAIKEATDGQKLSIKVEKRKLILSF